jgi:t-SNARE complex subunit (syntaxin)
MPRKSKAALSKEAQTQVKKRTDEMLDDDVEDVEFDESSVLAKTEVSTDDKMAMRRRLENYLEERRLQKELGDDFDYQ